MPWFCLRWVRFPRHLCFCSLPAFLTRRERYSSTDCVQHRSWWQVAAILVFVPLYVMRLLSLAAVQVFSSLVMSNLIIRDVSVTFFRVLLLGNCWASRMCGFVVFIQLFLTVWFLLPSSLLFPPFGAPVTEMLGGLELSHSWLKLLLAFSVVPIAVPSSSRLLQCLICS